MTQKEREEGASHTLLTVGTYNISTHFAPIKISHYSTALLIPFDRRWLISFMAFVLMTQTYKRLLKLKWGLQKLKWLIFDCCRKTNHLRYIWTDPVGEFRSVVKDTKSNTKHFTKSISIHSDYQSVHFLVSAFVSPFHHYGRFGHQSCYELQKTSRTLLILAGITFCK